jgi:Tol biopolymer transport system component/DNA-binding winged helix-turn-helix (wHTH) protein
MPVGEKQTYRFGPFELDAQCGQLRRDSVGLKLQGQPVQILEILLERPGQLVTREELRERLWNSDTFVDFDHSLNTAIKKLRQALGDEADTPRYIETLPRRGYRFVGEVIAEGELPKNLKTSPDTKDVVGRGATTLSDAAINPATDSRWQVQWHIWIVAATVVCLLGIPALYWLIRPLPMPHIVASHALTKSKNRKSFYQGLLLTDGANLYFQEKERAKLKTMQVRLPGGELSELKISAGDLDSLRDISKDGSELLLSVYDREAHRSDAWIQPLPAGSPRLVVKDARWPALSPDGQRIFFVRNNDKHLYQVKIDGTQVQQLATFPDFSGLAISPNGQRVRAFVGPTRAIWEAGVDGSNPHPIFREHKESVSQGNWSPDGKYFYFGSSDGDRLNLWVASEERSWLGKETQLRQLTFGPLGYGTPTVSKDGRHLYAVGREPHGQLSVYDQHSGQFVPYLNGISACFVDFSRDGRWVAYVSYPEGTLWRSRIDGSERRQLTVPPLAVMNPRWSPDGKLIAFMELSGGDRRSMSGRSRVYVVSAEGGGPLLLVGENEGGGADAADPTWSPDGTRVAYAAGGAADIGEIRVLDLARQKSAKIPGSEEMWSPRWSPNGRYLVTIKGYFPREEYLYNFDSQQWKELSPQHLNWPSWSRDSNSVYALRYDSTVRIAIPGGDVEKIGPFPDLVTAFWMAEGLGWLGVTPDGRPLTTLDTGIEEVYAFDLEYK